ncbi:hypothetical protein BTH41_03956 [Bacillus mycoides]|nr:hypothetical protein BTH41_03956 [Bacillus mycoides]
MNIHASYVGDKEKSRYYNELMVTYVPYCFHCYVIIKNR